MGLEQKLQREENSVNKKSFVRIMATAAMAAVVGAGSAAFAGTVPAPSGNMNLRLQGHEIVGTTQDSIQGIGQEIVNTAGNFAGDETFSYADPQSTATGVCGGAISAGAITFQGGSFGTEGEGQFTITMTFTPTTPVSNTPCQTTDYSLLCNRTLVHKTLADDLNAGQYHCVAREVTVGGDPIGASLEGHLDIVSGSNGSDS
jgi:hypothetical protein